MPTVAIKIHGTLKMGCMIWYMFNFKCVRPGERIHRWESHVYQSGVTDCDAACLSSVVTGKTYGNKSGQRLFFSVPTVIFKHAG